MSAKPTRKSKATRKASLADRICEAVKALTPERRGHATFTRGISS